MPAASNALREYIEQAKKQNKKTAQIKAELTAAGWDDRDVTAELNRQATNPAHAGGALAVPEPPSRPTRGVEYVIMLIALLVAAVDFGWLMHSTVNALLGADDGSNTTFMTVATSALVVSLPVYLFLFKRLGRYEDTTAAGGADKLPRDASRRRAIQTGLVVTFVIALGNMVSFVYNLFGGLDAASTITNARAGGGQLGNVIHLLVTLAIAGPIFAFYWSELHRAKPMRAGSVKRWITVVLVALLAIAAVAANIVVRQGPIKDARVITDFQQLQPLIDNYYYENNRFPAKLGSVTINSDIIARAAEYRYLPGKDRTYQLCARFETDTMDLVEGVYDAAEVDFRRHKKGDYCFTVLTASAREKQ